MYQVGIKNRFRASHFLVGDFAEETRPHEHEYVVEWICATNVLDENGFSVDIAVMEEELQNLVDRIRGKLLNDLEFFKDRQVSVENMAHYIHTALVGALERRSFSLESIVEFQVKIWESETAWAAYIHS
jgi:6-pyruvoyl-tetrahydropterin synthase